MLYKEIKYYESSSGNALFDSFISSAVALKVSFRSFPRSYFKMKVLIFSLLLLGTVSCLQEETCVAKEVLKENLPKLRVANNYLALNLHKKMSLQSDENLIFSPFTIANVLTVLYMGAERETAKELRKVLGFQRSKLEDPIIFATTHFYLTETLGNYDPYSYTFHCASALIVDQSFSVRPEFIAEVQFLYQAYVQDADIAHNGNLVLQGLNSWVETKSKGTIKSLVEAIDPATSLILASAAFFKGAWRNEFDPKDTENLPFYNGGRKSDKVDVPMMHTKATFRYHDEDGDFTAIELPYEGRNMSMIIILPHEIDGLPEVEQDLTVSQMAFIRRRMYHTKVHLTMPKFKLSFNKDLSGELRELGLKKAFTPSADFSGMASAASGLMVGVVNHKAMMEVNEQGSVAAAISSVIMTKMIQGSEVEPDFIVDHPFIFTVVDSRSGLILFMGRVFKLQE